MNRNALNLGGPSINPHWHVPRSLHLLEGELVALMILVDAWQRHLQSRLDGNGELTHELGIATSITVLAAHAAEVSPKALLAQTHPTEKPRTFGQHQLSKLFSALDSSVQLEVEKQFVAMPTEWEKYIGEEYGDSVGSIFSIADNSFVDWRYIMEDGASGGIPKGVLKATAAARIVCAKKLRLWQVPQTTSEELTSIPDVLVKPAV